MVEERIINEHIDLLKSSFLFCSSLEGVHDDVAYVVMSDDNRELNNKMIDILPEVICTNCYSRLVLISGEEVINDNYKCITLSRELIDNIVTIQRAFHPFRNIYVNSSKGYDDNDFLCFVNDEDVDLDYIIRNVFFDLPRAQNRKRSKNIFDKNKTWEKIYKNIMMYEQSYSEIRKSFPNGKLFIHPFVSGDMYMSCLYLRDYVEGNGIEEYEVLVSNKGAQKVGELFGIESHIVDKEKLIQAVFFQRVFGEEIANIKNTHMCVGSQRGNIFLHKIDYNTHEQKWIYQARERKSQPRLIQRNSDAFFDEYNLIPEKTVLISPFSYSVCPVERDYYRDIINGLHDRGYQVCTNISKGEENLPNTIGVFLPYDTVIDFVDKSAGFVGMRSGLCDIVSSTSTKMVVYHKEFCFNQFSLERMGLKTSNILELCIDVLPKEVIVEKTLEAFK